MAFLTTKELGENYGLNAQPYLFDFLIKGGFVVKFNNNYKLTKIGKKFGKISYVEGQRKILWDEEKMMPIISKIKENMITQSGRNFNLYHMTHINNLSSIFTQGLLSHNLMQELNYIDISNQDVNNRRNGNEPFFGKSIHDYVPFYFNIRNPMLFSTQTRFRQDVIILEIDIKACLVKNTLFTDRNAATDNVNFFDCIKEFLDTADWQSIHTWSWFEREPIIKQKMMAECLIPNQADKTSIINIHCQNEAIANKVFEALKSKDVKVENIFYGDKHFFKKLMEGV